MAKKRNLIIGMVLVLICLTFAISLGSNKVEAEGPAWTGQADISWYNKSSNTFTINTVSKLAGIAKLVNEDPYNNINGFEGVRLEVSLNLDLNGYVWIPIGTAEKPFKGVLIAENEDITISNMKPTEKASYIGLVGFMDGGTIGGFNFADSGIIDVKNVTQNVYVGSAVGKMINSSTVYGITNNIVIDVNASGFKAYAGGIVGSGEFAISNSVNNRRVTATGSSVYAGGIVGYADFNDTTIKKVFNHGKISANGTAGGEVYSGGIAGKAMGSILMGDENTQIENLADITATGGTSSYAGGILGHGGSEVNLSSLTINTGAINVNAPQATSSFAGGLVGSIGAEQMNPIYNVAIASPVPVTNIGGTNVHTGGIVGYVNSQLTWVTSYTNNKVITASSSSGAYTGGLFGRVNGKLILEGSVTNIAPINVTGHPDEAYTGGFIGYSGNRVMLDSHDTDAYVNNGVITVEGGTGVYTGGLIGNRGYTRTDGQGSTNVTSIADIKVNGTKQLYTGGFIGIIPDEGVDKVISGRTFAASIEVTAASSDPEHRNATGGIVGYAVNGELNSLIYQGHLTVKGGADSYTGGIVGILKGGSVNEPVIGNTVDEFAVIKADGYSGGVAGNANGLINKAAVKFLNQIGTWSPSVMGGVVGKAEGQISFASVGSDIEAEGTSVTLTANVTNAVDGKDQVTAGGIIGVNEKVLTLTNSSVSRISLAAGSGRSEYTLGAIAGLLTLDANVGTDAVPIKADSVSLNIAADNSKAGGTVGFNQASKLYASVSDSTFIIKANGVAAGGVVGVNAVAAESLPSYLKATEISLTVDGSSNSIGGLYGRNSGAASASLAKDINITSEGTSNQLGGIAGRNAGTLTGSQTQYIHIIANGLADEAGGVAGRSEPESGITVPAIIRDAQVLAGNNPLSIDSEALITTTGSQAKLGGIVGYARMTDIFNPKVYTDISMADYVEITVQGDHSMVGGIAGQMVDGNVSGDSIVVNIDKLLLTTTVGATDTYAGGLVGYNQQTSIQRAVGENLSIIISSPNSIVGGIAGYNLGSSTAIIKSSYATSINLQVKAAAAHAIIGGFVGLNDKQGLDPIITPATAISSIQNSRVVGTINTLSPASITGGMIGENRSFIANNSITDKNAVISKGAGGTVGGLIGFNTATGVLYYVYSNVNMTSEGEGTLAGGLVGQNEGGVKSSYIDIDLTSKAYGTASKSAFLGGLAGRNSGTIEQSYTASKVTASGEYAIVGGLVGEQTAGSILNSYVAKDVIANKAHSHAGGFLGRITGGQVTNTYSAANVLASNGAYAGGFAGRYDNVSKQLLSKSYYIKDDTINKDLPDFAEGNHRNQLAASRLNTITPIDLKDRLTFPTAAGWDFNLIWKYGSLQSVYKYPELNRTANNGGDAGNEVNANINWYTRDKAAIIFEVKTEAELAGLAAIVNGTLAGVTKFDFADRIINVTEPIHIQSQQWEPIGSQLASPFQGTFNGANQLIDGLVIVAQYEYSGLFGVIGENATVKDINLEPGSIAGSSYTGALAGLNKGTLANIDIRLLEGAKVSGKVVGAIVGKNIGALSGLSLALEDGSRVEAAYENSVVGTIIGDNTFDFNAQTYTLKVTNGSVGSAQSHSIVGGLIGKQAGSVTGLNVAISKEFKISATGANNILGGIVGQYVSGAAADLAIVFTDGTLEARGADSILGGVIGKSESNNKLRNITVSASDNGLYLSANGTLGGIVGIKTGSGSPTFDMENVAASKLTLTSLNESTHAIVGGIAGQLTDTIVSNASFDAVMRINGERATAGGIVGIGYNSLLYKVNVQPDIIVNARSGESAIGGIAGTFTSNAINKEFDLGNRIPYYYGIYDAIVQDKPITVTGLTSSPDLYVGGIAGKLIKSSLYNSRTASDLVVSGAKTAVVGGLAGYSNGIIVRSEAQSSIAADSSSIYYAGGAVGLAAGGEIHYAKMDSTSSETLTIGSSVTKQGIDPLIQAGGFVGTSDDTKITHSFTHMAIVVNDTHIDGSIFAGGFAGQLGNTSANQGQISQAFATGSLSIVGKSGAYAGGFAGSVNHYSITDAYASGEVSNKGYDARTGGFAATVEKAAYINQSYAVQSKVTTAGSGGSAKSYTGGFAGYNDGTLNAIYAHATEISTVPGGSGIYLGALIGYNFRDGNVSAASYASSLPATGHNVDGTVAAIKAAQPNPLAAANWDYDADTLFLSEPGTGEIAIATAKRLEGVVLLNNEATGLDYYKLFNRTAVQRPAMPLLTIYANLNLNHIPFTPFDKFAGTLNGKDFTITGLFIKSEQAEATGFIVENSGVIENLNFNNASIQAGSNSGIAAGINHQGAIIRNVSVNGAVVGGDQSGGLTGQNDGTITKSNVGGLVTSAKIGAISSAGGITGVNGATGSITESFSFADVEANGALAVAGGIAGTSNGEILNSYNSGRILANGTGKAWAGGIAGHAINGSIGQSYNSGEAVAGIGGKLIPLKTYFGGIVGQLEATASISTTVFNKQMLKMNTAYYDAQGTRVKGTAANATGLLSSNLTSASLPAGFNPSIWLAEHSFTPRFQAASGTTASLLSAAAVIMNEGDLVNRLASQFELSSLGTGALTWTTGANSIQLNNSLNRITGYIRTTDSTVITATFNGSTRTILIQQPFLKFDEIAAKPVVVSGAQSFFEFVSVALSTSELNGQIYYTLNGAEPTENSQLYTGPIALDKSTYIKAITMVDNKEVSPALSDYWLDTSEPTPPPSAGIPSGPQPVIIPTPTPTPTPMPSPEPKVTVQLGNNKLEQETAKEPIVIARNSKLVLTAPEGYIIYYTTDGTVPTALSPQYKAEMLVTKDMIIKAIHAKDKQEILFSFKVVDAKYSVKNDADVIKYFNSYSGTKFKPNAALTRFELIEALIPLLDMEDVSLGNLFSDVNASKADLVAFFSSAGIIQGFPNGTFGGERELTRAEFVVVLSRLLKLDITQAGITKLSDVKGHWSEKYVNAFTKVGYLKGFPDGTFKANNAISRAESIVVINRIMGTHKQKLPSKFSDLPSTHWAYDDIMSVVN